MVEKTYEQIIESAPETSTEVSPEFLSTLGDVIQRENTVYNVLTNPLSIYRKYLKTKDPNFDKTPYIEGYDPSLFERAWDVEDIERIKSQVNYENELVRSLSDASTANVLTARLLSGVTEPLNLITIATGGAGGALASAGRMAINAASAISAQELLLHGQQLTRSVEESVENIIAGTVLNTALGGLIGYLSPTKRIEVRDALKDSLGWVSEESKIAASLKTSTANYGLPAVRTMDYASNLANQSFEKLLKSKLYREKNLGLNPSDISAETLAAMESHGDIFKTAATLQGNYAKYKKRVGSGIFGDHLSFAEFKHEVSRAGHRGAQSEIPEAAKAAKYIQENILGKYREKLINARLMDPLNLQTTDKSYFPTMYNKEKMLSDRSGFIDALMKGFRNTFEKTASSINEIEAQFKTKDPHVQKVPTPDSIEDRILGLWRERLGESGIDSNGVEYVPTKFSDEKIDILYDQYKNKDIILKERLLDKEEFKKEAYKQLYDEFDGKEIDKLEAMYNYMTSTPEILKRSAEDVYNLQIGNSPESRNFGIGGGKPSMTKSRMDVSREDLFDYLNLDAEQVVSNYIRQASGASEVVGKFLPEIPHNDLVSLNEVKSSILNKVHEDYRGLINNAVDKKLQLKLEKENINFKKDFEYYFDYVSGRPMDISKYEGAARAGAVIRKVNNARLMGNVTISSLNEPIRIQISNGILNMFRDLPDHIKALWSVFRNARPSELQEAGIANNMFLNSRIAEMQQLNSDFSRTTKFERGVDIASKKIFDYSLLNAWSDYTDVVGSTLFSKRAIEMGKRLSEGKKVSNDRLVEFASFGLSPDDLKGIHENYSKYGDIRDFNKYTNVDMWDNKELAKKFEAARYDAVGTMLVKKTAASIPQILQDTEVGRMASQYQNWSISATTDIGIRSAQQMAQGDSRGLTQIIGQVLSSIPTVMLKSLILGYEINSIHDLLLKAIDESGIMGIYGSIMDKTNEATGNKLSVFLGGEQKPYRHKKGIGELSAGPTGKAVDDMIDILADVFTGDVNRKTIKKARTLLPGQNIFITKKLFDEGQEIVSDALDLPDTNRKRG